MFAVYRELCPNPPPPRSLTIAPKFRVQYGGKVTTSVSSKTTYLMLGSVLDDGRPPTDGR